MSGKRWEEEAGNTNIATNITANTEVLAADNHWPQPTNSRILFSSVVRFHGQHKGENQSQITLKIPLGRHHNGNQPRSLRKLTSFNTHCVLLRILELGGPKESIFLVSQFSKNILSSRTTVLV